MYDHMVDSHLEDFTGFYELNDDQQQQVRIQLEKLKLDQREYGDARRDRMRELGDKMREMWNQRRDGQPGNEERMDQIRDEMRTMFRDAPLMNLEKVADAIEPLLPAEQVAVGRPRVEARVREWQQRRDDMRRNFAEGRGWGGPGGSSDGWDRLTERFAENYGLDEAQRATAQSILNELKAQRDRYQASHEADFAAARNIEDREQRSKRLDDLSAPVQSLYDQLQTRLNQIPTASQKEAYQNRPDRRPDRPQTRPAGDARTRGRAA
jgi:hypothetical protein